MPGLFAAAYQRNVTNLTPLIGLEASVATVRANNWGALGWAFGILLFVPLGTWAQLGAPALVWIPVAISGLGCIFCVIHSFRLGVRSGRLASDFVSRELGCRVELRGGSWRPTVWQRRIETARRRAEPYP